MFSLSSFSLAFGLARPLLNLNYRARYWATGGRLLGYFAVKPTKNIRDGRREGRTERGREEGPYP